MKQVKVKHISFDLWNTILKSNPLYNKNRITLLNKFFPKLPHNKISHIVFETNNFFSDLSKKNGLGYDSKEQWLKVFSKLSDSPEKINTTNFSDFISEHNQMLLSDSKYYPEIIDDNIIYILRLLKEKNITTNILSNVGFISGSQLSQILAEYGLLKYFTFTLFSDEQKFSKPDKRFFNLILDNTVCLNLFPEEILHVGDDTITDILGAKNVNMQSLLFSPSTPNTLKILNYI